MSEAPERIWVWGWRADSVWQEQTWQHEDEPMSTMEYVRVDLVEAAEQRGYANAMEAERKLHEARIEELEAKLAKAVAALQFIKNKISWEINPSNYDHKDVCDMNSDWCEVGAYAEDTLAELKGAKT